MGGEGVRERVIRTWIRVTDRLRSDRGATAVEYALMVALIALVVFTAVAFLGQSTNSQFANSDLTNTLG
jgi:pilus assembly protein Flp/PilA